MSTAIKSILILIIIAAAGAALWWSGWLNNIGIMMPKPADTTDTTPAPTDTTPAVVNDLPTAADNTTDAALVQDTASLDVQIQATGGDATQIDQGLNDKPIAQQQTIVTANIPTTKDKAAQELDRRVAGLQTLATRITAMTKVTAELKTNINTVIQNQVQAFTALKTETTATTTLIGVQTAIKAVNDSYRVYALIIPQASIIAASDRIVTINSMLNGIGLKLKARIEAAQAAGADVTAVGATLTDLGVKIDSANTHAQAAVNGSVTLLPDEGDKTKMAANTKALTDARTDIKGAHTDITAARKDITTILAALATLSVQTNTNTSAGTQ